jgi:AraC-like DNA-binding protein
MESGKEQYPKVYLYRRIVQAKLFIEVSYNKEIDLSKIADEAFFSKFHFMRLFKSTYGKTPHQFLTQVRINKAQELLQNDSIKVGDVCFAVGFDSISSFTGLFKRLVGVTPSAYQLQQRLRRDAIKKEPLNFVPGCFSEKAGWK